MEKIEKIKEDLETTDAIFEDVEKTIVVFGSARMDTVPANSECYDYIERHSRNMVKNLCEWDQNEHGKQTFHFVTGGGPGVMKYVNEEAKNSGFESIGIGIDLPHENGLNDGVSEGKGAILNYFFTRKVSFLQKSVAIVVFPGGFGTLDELFETLTLIQTNKIPKQKVFLFQKEFWKRLINFRILLHEGLISESDMELINIVDTSQELVDELSKIIKTKT